MENSLDGLVIILLFLSQCSNPLRSHSSRTVSFSPWTLLLGVRTFFFFFFFVFVACLAKVNRIRLGEGEIIVMKDE